MAFELSKPASTLRILAAARAIDNWARFSKNRQVTAFALTWHGSN
jgi:hypothetical protein